MSGVKVFDENDPDHKGLWLFGTDLTRIECFRDSVLNGCAGAAAGSIIGFIYRNSFSTAVRAAMVSYFIVTVYTWFPCRYAAYKRREQFKNLQKAREDKVEKSGDYNLPPVLEAKKKDTPDG